MKHKRVLFGLMLGTLLLIGSHSAIGAMWEHRCQVAIEDLKQLQQDIVQKKQELDAARVAEAIPSNFVSREWQESLNNHTRGQALREMKSLFQNVEFALSALSNSCLKNNEVAQ